MYFSEYFLSHFSQYPTLLLFFFAGTIDIPTNSLALGQEMETWHPISLASSANNDGASLRIRAKYQRNLILPLGIYNELLEVNMLFTAGEVNKSPIQRTIFIIDQILT